MVFTSLNKPIFFFYCWKGFCTIISLGILVLIHSKQVGKSAQCLFFCNPYWFVLGYTLNFPSMNFTSLNAFCFLILFWSTVDMSISVPSDKCLEI